MGRSTRIASSIAILIALAAMDAPATETVVSGPDGTGRSERRVIVKFEEDARVRLLGSRPASLAGRDLGRLEVVLRRHGGATWHRLFARPEHETEAERVRAERRTGRSLPDLNAYLELHVDPPATDALLEALRALPIVRHAYRAPLPVPSPVDIPPTTPDGEPDQVYLDPAPEGIDARDGWTRPGGNGAGVKIIDIEYDWRDTHEDLETALGARECPTGSHPGEIEHGTAVLGELVGGDNGYGVTGISSGADVGLVTHWPTGMTYSVARAIECATGLLGPGDVLLIEAQTVGPNGLFVPPEWDAAEYDAIVVAVAKGIVVVETAGNGNDDLDLPSFGGAFDRNQRDSGATIVGAGADLWYETQPDRSRLEFSTYGTRVDLQGWGDDVVTTGYGDAFDGGGDPNQYYTSLFSGTSSAAPMIAGAAAVVQGVQMACGGAPLDPVEVRDLLAATGSPQVPGPYPGNIGPRPDLRAALQRVDVDDDGDTFAECQGDCDDGTAATHPGADEINDGLDNQCPGEVGAGTVDETSGDSGFHDQGDTTRYSWTAQAGATRYEVARSTSPAFDADCTAWETTDTFVVDAEEPSAGTAFFYLNRPLLPNAGSWGADSEAAERSGACL